MDISILDLIEGDFKLIFIISLRGWIKHMDKSSNEKGVTYDT